MTAVPEWMRPPRPEGWYAEDLDHLPEAPRHTELIDATLVFTMLPQRSWHARLITALVVAHYWRVEDEDGSPVVHAYELDEPTRSYVATEIHRRALRTTTPFAISLDLDGLVPGQKS
ncbi:hypothetical protein ACIBSW_03860 [Actinoplanes sp. NPDC049668]|uniref:hypothetical protein n=1 Tax=unclassified Actinoplanes TaxID=2626549 RepID=UPI00339E3892